MSRTGERVHAELRAELKPLIEVEIGVEAEEEA
jgi:hypothetical protein